MITMLEIVVALTMKWKMSVNVTRDVQTHGLPRAMSLEKEGVQCLTEGLFDRHIHWLWRSGNNQAVLPAVMIFDSNYSPPQQEDAWGNGIQLEITNAMMLQKGGFNVCYHTLEWHHLWWLPISLHCPEKTHVVYRMVPLNEDVVGGKNNLKVSGEACISH